MNTDIFAAALKGHHIEFFTGVPDSLLGKFCDYLMHTYGINPRHHVVAHNEGGCVALATGYHLATGKVPCVYMQNSGIGNALNPVASLAHPKVYGIPMLLVIGWRGEPGTKDEPQHIFQGEVTMELLRGLEIETFILDKDTSPEQLEAALEGFQPLFAQGKSAAIVVRKGAFSGEKYIYRNQYLLNREQAVQIVAQAAGDDAMVSTTGKISRELFEFREQAGQGHGRDFLTVGSMGHSAMIALGIALQQPDRRVWCLDGDGAVLMHMGALGVVASQQPRNYIHVVLNNCAHETVGGVPTVAGSMRLTDIALACGYRKAYRAEDEAALRKALDEARQERGPVFVEVMVALGAREDLGRPTTTAQENKLAFMEYLTEGRQA